MPRLRIIDLPWASGPLAERRVSLKLVLRFGRHLAGGAQHRLIISPSTIRATEETKYHHFFRNSCTQHPFSTPVKGMGLSVVAPRFAVPTPSPNSAESVNIKNYGSRASIDFMEAATRVNASSRTQPSAIPAISYKLLGSSSNTGKSPLDLLLSNPIQFVKASMMSPVYKRNQAEAFGASNFMSKGKRGAMKV